jgi:hypothetical protein
MAEAERDIEALLDGKEIKPNAAATTAYKQKFVDYMQDNEENVSMEQFRLLANYVIQLDDVIMRNTVRAAQNMIAKQQLQQFAQQAGQPPQAPLAPPQGQPVGQPLINNQQPNAQV